MAPLSSEMRKLQNKWKTGTSWPKRLDWLEISGIRGWTGQRIDFQFPIVAIVGENGSGKSTVLQAAAAVYKSEPKDRYASDFFPDTPFEKISSATIRYSYRQGQESQTKTVRKPTNRWRGNPERPSRKVEYIDLRRIQPVSARTGYARILKHGVKEETANSFDNSKLGRLNKIVGKSYSTAGISTTDAGIDKPVPVLSVNGVRYSGFHQGAGEIAAAELLAADFPKYGILLIDEIETSLHPRAQRRLMRDLAEVARLNEIQIVLTTHSPYILDEIPPEARIYLMDGVEGKSAVLGVSPEFAMSRMDEEQHPECDIYVEDKRADTFVAEILAKQDRDLLTRSKIVSFGAASVGEALGQMVQGNRFPRSSVVFLDGDQSPSAGCSILPGDEAPERVVFESLRTKDWPDISTRISRGPSETIDALNAAMTLSDHHDWVKEAADRLVIGGDILWQSMCASWVENCADDSSLQAVVSPIAIALA
ncbi:ATP-dependent nuclease [Novosphingobium mangrovi (ex Hu et al. 2023)]|uniref:AAA family ATPase n=1 Tax=Novosphingobium mangrovi (ex Hu et al. 2023) TaxID=2930094 RepID=A0ABT0AEY7_9SPHN|nr:AAA family ATPase [Novosphingobium mangrovi (ex Hu et al. 2023)]MCJ1961765.1 AAA family ATPase [Novosphingobium mangrovi (ex Hu et al. 2023)]